MKKGRGGKEERRKKKELNGVSVLSLGRPISVTYLGTNNATTRRNLSCPNWTKHASSFMIGFRSFGFVLTDMASLLSLDRSKRRKRRGKTSQVARKQVS